jgi:predicted transcriptional regulator
MNTVTIGVASLAETQRRLAAGFKGNVEAQAPRIDFISFELLHKVLTPKRWEILKVMSGQGPMTMREVARRVDRDFKGVHTDIHALILAGLLDRQIIGTESGVLFPYDAVHLDVTMATA